MPLPMIMSDDCLINDYDLCFSLEAVFIVTAKGLCFLFFFSILDFYLLFIFLSYPIFFVVFKLIFIEV